MIARTWRGATATADADAYVEFLDRTGVADCRAIPGNRGVYVLRRPAGDRTEFLFVSLWDDMGSVRAFAGDDPTRARFYAEDERLLVDRDWHVDHFTVERAVVPFDREATT
jgi:heme-degrading monooxygenase HmoA